MVYDNIDNVKIYENLHKGFKKAFEFLSNYKDMPSGRVVIDGDDVYAIVNNDYKLKAIDNTRYEAHKKYIDIQYIIKGTEKFGVQDVAGLKENTKYDETKDIAFFDGKDGNLITLSEKQFIIIYPHEAHLPACKDNKEQTSRIIIKVKI